LAPEGGESLLMPCVGHGPGVRPITVTTWVDQVACR
jgi:hypothetical protein